MRRPCRLAEGALDELDAYLGKLREALDTRYARLDDLLARMAEGTEPTRKRTGKQKR